jgi:hypothetical protein
MQGKLSEAKEMYERSLDLSIERAPNSQMTIAIYYKLGKIKFEMGDNEGARQVTYQAFTAIPF